MLTERPEAPSARGPATPPPPAAPARPVDVARLGPLASPLGAVRRRVRLQAAFEAAARGAVVGGVVAAWDAFFYRLGELGPRAAGAIAVGAALCVVAGALAGALRRVPLLGAAERLDRAFGLHDRLGSALVFLGEPAQTPFMQAAIADAVRQAARLEARRAAPFRRPEALVPALLAWLLALVFFLFRFPGAHPVQPVTPKASTPKFTVPSEVLEPEREAAAELRREAERTGDEQTKEAANEIEKLLAALDKGELTRKQVFDKLAEIEKKLPLTSDRDFEALKHKLRPAGAELGKSKLGKEAGQALKDEDLLKAKSELEKLAAEAERLAKDAQAKVDDAQKKKDAAQRQRDQEELARALEKAAQQLQQQQDEDRPRRLDRRTPEEKKREAEEQKLRDEERRLKKELEKHPENQELQRQLDKTKRELERLDREKKQREEERRELERLQREMQKAAEELRKQLSPEQAEQLRKLAQQLGQMEQETRKLGNGKRMQLTIGELKEMLRRAGQSGQGQNGQGQGQDGDGQGQGQGQGKNGKGNLRGDFQKRAGGGGEQILTLGGKGDGDTQVMLPIPGMGQQPGGQGQGQQPGGQGQDPGQGKQGDGKDPGQGGQGQGQNPGNGIGDQHTDQLYGAATELGGKHVDSRVKGREAAGPSRSETILGSAQKGFATRSYKKVYGDYSAVAEDVMTKEQVPPGYRFYVKRYFQLIKPRE